MIPMPVYPQNDTTIVIDNTSLVASVYQKGKRIIIKPYHKA